MGKRRDRRHAAMATAGRRVKLDLFADVSGEASMLERGEDVNPSNHTVVPSPSSSVHMSLAIYDKKEENPLLLLGQYTDEETDEELVDEPTASANEGPNSSNVEVEDKIGGTAGTNDNEESAASSLQLEAIVENDVKYPVTEGSIEETASVSATIVQTKCQPAADNVHHAAGMQVVGEIGENWKIVMHEESNQCYYWNTVTGETSWDIPTTLMQEGVNDGAANLSAVALANDVETDTQILSATTCSHAGADHGTELNAADGYLSNTAVANGLSEHASVSLDSDPLRPSTIMSEHLMIAQDDFATPHSAELIKYGADLLQRLKELRRHGSLSDDLEWIKREIEVRVSDCQALSSYGPAVLPFWWHTKLQLAQLESTICKAEVSMAADGNKEKVEDFNSCEGHLDEGAELAEDKKDGEDNMLASFSDEPKEETSHGTSMPEAFQGGKLSPEPLDHDSEKGVSFSKVESDIEDVDMEVDMEAEDTGHEITHSLTGQVQLNMPLSEHLPPIEDADVPVPPPDDDWIPPPPPDVDPIAPPPPPEEPAEPYNHIEQPYNHVEGIPEVPPDMVYAVPVTDDYAPVQPEVSEINYYIQPDQSDGSLILEPQPTYLFPVSSVVTALAAFPSINTMAYYSFPAVPAETAVCTSEISGYHVPSVAASADAILDAKTNDTASKGTSVSSAMFQSSISNARAKSVERPAEVVVASTSGTLDSSMPANPALSSTTENQAKVAVRGRKRTVSVSSSLRSNKKVSSLVDKWKAVKKELHAEDDDETDSPYDAFERKRQKEIKQWHAQQIASGEAEENANFVPLGGDWRERVKHRISKSEGNSVQQPSSKSENQKEQADTEKLSKGLPSGWKAYWDESSGQIYYGNMVTSETSWTKPT